MEYLTTDEINSLISTLKAWQDSGFEQAQIDKALKNTYGIDLKQVQEFVESRKKSSLKQKLDRDSKKRLEAQRQLEEQKIEERKRLRNSRERKVDTGSVLSARQIKELNEEEARLEERKSMEFIKKLLIEDQNKKKSRRSELQKEHETKSACGICFDSLFLEESLPFFNCIDIFHTGCLEQYVVEQIRKRSFPILCPNPECRQELNASDIKFILEKSPEHQRCFDEYTLKFLLDSNPDEFLHCLTPDCDYVFSINPNSLKFVCPQCSEMYCVKCKISWHENLGCEEVKQLRLDKEFMDFMRKSGFKQCPQCHQVIKRTEGCNQMVCARCQTKFCYQCGKRGNAHLCFHLGSSNNNEDGMEKAAEDKEICSLM